MNLEEQKIPDPFKAPEGYFEDFEANLLQKMKPGTRTGRSVQLVNRPVMEYVAIAATLTAIMVTTWVVFIQDRKVEPSVAVTVPKTLPKIEPLPVQSDSVIAAVLADKVAEEILLQPDNQNPVGADPTSLVLNAKDKEIAKELEDAGLIVMDANDGLFDTFEL